ncbi:hypothetical protein [Micromonospora sp. LOL_023]
MIADGRFAAGDGSVVPGLLPAERPYPLPAAVGAIIGATTA